MNLHSPSFRKATHCPTLLLWAFQVVLMDAVEMDDVGAPVASEWFLKAFGSGEGTKRRSSYIHVVVL